MDFIIDFIIEIPLTAFSLLLAAVGLFLTLRQLESNIKIRKAEFINQINDKIRLDKEFAEILYKIEYGDDWYTKDFHKDIDIQFKFDKIFSYLDYICYLKSMKNITENEFKVFKYRINRVCISSSTKEYLWNLFQFAKKNNSSCSFQCLLDYGIKAKLITKNIKTNNNLYPNKKYLNF
jgi:hypothetical protein